MDYRLIIFDFDGTLADSFPFFAGVFNQLAARHGFRPIDAAEVPALRQRSPRELMEHVGMPRWKLPLVAKDFIALMRQNQHQVQLFDGVPRMLRDLAEADLQLAIVSSNAEDNVRRILGADTVPLFASYECGMSIFGKSSRLDKVLHKLAVPAVNALYIGDQSTDAEAARSAGVAFAAVAWGYGTIESLRAHQPEVEFATVADIARLLRAA